MKQAVVGAKNEVMEMIDLPIIKGKYLYKMSDRTDLQYADNVVKYITTRKINSFESLAKFTADREKRYEQLFAKHF